MAVIDPEEECSPRCLITGATGFIGEHLARHLISHGWTVHAISRAVAKLSRLSDEVTGHLYNGSYESISAAIEKAKPDVVFHVASHFLSNHEPNQITSLLEANLQFGTQLLEAMRYNGTNQLINIGTIWQHYNGASYDPVNLYAATKQAFEAIIDYYSRAHGISGITIKLHDTYGPRDKRNKLIPNLIRAITNDEHLAMTEGYQKLRLSHVEDICDVILRCSKLIKVNDHLRFSLGSNAESYSVREIVALLESTTGKSLSITWGAIKVSGRVMTNAPQIPGEKIDLKPKWNLRQHFESLRNLQNL